MSKEKAIQAMRKNKASLVATVKVSELDVKNLAQDANDCSYVPMDDYKELLTKAARSLTPVAADKDSEYAYGVEKSIVMKTLVSVLRVEKKTDLPESSSKDKSARDIKHAEEIRKTFEDASKVAATLAKATDDADYETFAQAMSDVENRAAVTAVLFNSSAGTTKITQADGQELQPFAKPPRSLACKTTFDVRVTVLSVHSEDGVAEVKLEDVAKTKSKSLDQLKGKNLRMTFSKTELHVRQMLIAAQLVNRSLQCSVGATIGLKTANSGQTFLSFLDFANVDAEKKDLSKFLHQMSFDF